VLRGFGSFSSILCAKLWQAVLSCFCSFFICLVPFPIWHWVIDESCFPSHQISAWDFLQAFFSVSVWAMGFLGFVAIRHLAR
jgi:hypothetical protein